MIALTHRLGISALAVGIALTLGLASGCSSPPAEPGVPPETGPSAGTNTPVDSSEFWAGFQVSAQEVNPASSLSDLADRAEIIVTGTVLGLEAGPSTEPHEGPTLSTVALIIHIDEVLKGTFTDNEIKIVLAPAGQVNLDTPTKPSNNQIMAFLVPAQPGYFASVSLAGLVEDTPHGLVTVIDPTQSILVANGQRNESRTFPDLISEVRER